MNRSGQGAKNESRYEPLLPHSRQHFSFYLEYKMIIFDDNLAKVAMWILSALIIGAIIGSFLGICGVGCR